MCVVFIFNHSGLTKEYEKNIKKSQKTQSTSLVPRKAFVEKESRQYITQYQFCTWQDILVDQAIMGLSFHQDGIEKTN